MNKCLLVVVVFFSGCSGYNPTFNLQPKAGVEKPVATFDSDRKDCIAAVNSVYGDFMGGPAGAGGPIMDDPKGKTYSELQNRTFRQNLESKEQEFVFKHQEMKDSMYLNCMNSRGWFKPA